MVGALYSDCAITLLLSGDIILKDEGENDVESKDGEVVGEVDENDLIKNMYLYSRRSSRYLLIVIRA